MISSFCVFALQRMFSFTSKAPARPISAINSKSHEQARAVATGNAVDSILLFKTKKAV